jgi:hypothetical protein
VRLFLTGHSFLLQQPCGSAKATQFMVFEWFGPLTDTARGEKHLFTRKIQVILASS